MALSQTQTPQFLNNLPRRRKPPVHHPSLNPKMIYWKFQHESYDDVGIADISGFYQQNIRAWSENCRDHPLLLQELSTPNNFNDLYLWGLYGLCFITCSDMIEKYHLQHLPTDFNGTFYQNEFSINQPIITAAEALQNIRVTLHKKNNEDKENNEKSSLSCPLEDLKVILEIRSEHYSYPNHQFSATEYLGFASIEKLLQQSNTSNKFAHGLLDILSYYPVRETLKNYLPSEDYWWWPEFKNKYLPRHPSNQYQVKIFDKNSEILNQTDLFTVDVKCFVLDCDIRQTAMNAIHQTSWNYPLTIFHLPDKQKFYFFQGERTYDKLGFDPNDPYWDFEELNHKVEMKDIIRSFNSLVLQSRYDEDNN